MTKQRRITLILLTVFFVGISVFLYPSFATWWNSKNQSKMVTSYDKLVDELSIDDTASLFKAAREYNEKLKALDFPLTDYKSVTGYSDTLNVNGKGMIGYLSIDKIQLDLPVYHTVSDTVLGHSAGHLPGTSLPVGGDGTHAVISAHRGLPSAKLFTNLDRLEIGDTFKITVLDKVFIYSVDQIKVVLPNDVNDIQIEDGKDYCTLLTCTPYGINTHRLLVRGVRTDTLNQKKLFLSSEAYRVDTVIVTACVSLPILFGLILYVIFKPAKKKITPEMLMGTDDKKL